MTIASSTNKHVYAGNGVTTEWPFTFSYDDSGDIKLYLTDADGTISEITTNYTLDTANSEVVYPSVASGLPALTASQKITIIRESSQTQEVDLKNQGPFAAEVIEQALDKLTMMVQDQAETLARTVKFPIDETPAATDTEEFLSDVQAGVSLAQTSATAASASAAAALVSQNAAAQSAIDASASKDSASLSAASASASLAAMTASAITALTGDVTASGPGSVAATIAAKAVTATKVGSGAATSGWVLTADGAGGASFAAATGGVSFPIDGGTASSTQQITMPGAATATLNALTRKAGNLYYNTTTKQLVMDNGTTLIPLEGLVTSNFTGTQITPVAAHDQKFRYTGVSAQVLTSIDNGSVSDGQHIMVLGTSDTNTITISDSASNVLTNGPWVGGLGSMIEFMYDASLALYVEMGRNFI